MSDETLFANRNVPYSEAGYLQDLHQHLGRAFVVLDNENIPAQRLILQRKSPDRVWSQYFFKGLSGAVNFTNLVSPENRVFHGMNFEALEDFSIRNSATVEIQKRESSNQA